MNWEFVDRVWYSNDSLASAARTALTPFERAFRGVVGARDMLYDAGILPLHDTAIPAISVGNLTVGGTGKTPVSAWLARGLVTRGAHPAIVMRGYGDDEPLVHHRLNPDVPVITNPDRVQGIADAAKHGADVAVLDDGFQHRRAKRSIDLVLIGADRWTDDVRLLPAGPWREPLEALRRASMIIVTRKAAGNQLVELVHERLARVAPTVPRVGVRLEMGELVRASETEGVAATAPLMVLAGQAVHAVASIGDPRAFVAQLEALGARVTVSLFPDHHRFSDEDIAGALGAVGPSRWVVCTLKDAVKLGPRWPRLAPPLWYVSQHVMVERGVGGIERLLDDFVRTRSQTATQTAG
ncbi:MAG: tetraacyldisaccharide 4'-kinase [Gemmatimonadaceae bacterium]